MSNYLSDIKYFVRNHRALCGCTLGGAIFGYAVGNLAGRIVRSIQRHFGLSKKTNRVASSIIQNLLQAYRTPIEGWVMVPPKDELQPNHSFVIGSGAIGYKDNGRWKVHVSISPSQMEEAIPILMEVLHSPHAPRLGFKMQTSANLRSVHQIGKEVAIIFSKSEERATLQNKSSAIQDCLNLLWEKLYRAGIRAEDGHLLTAETIEEIETAPQQIKEKENLLAGKFDRAIPCPRNCNYFHYRDENFAPIRDNCIGDLRGTPGVYAASDILELARTRPKLAHNPMRVPDPFLEISIQEFVSR